MMGETPVAILATAHACKFEEAVVAAIGADAWREYRASSAFPARAPRARGGAGDGTVRAAAARGRVARGRAAALGGDDSGLARGSGRAQEGLAVLGECVDDDDLLDGIEEGDIDPGHAMSSDGGVEFRLGKLACACAKPQPCVDL